MAVSVLWSGPGSAESFELLGGGTTTVISSSASFWPCPFGCSSPAMLESSAPLTPFSTGGVPLILGLSVEVSLEFFRDAVVLVLEDVERAGAALSLDEEL